MRLILLCTLTMIAFAANSVLNRMALTGSDIGPAGFAAIRLLAGAAVLVALVLARRGTLRLHGIGGALSLAVYMIGFSFAYRHIDAGVGALILFGMVQLTMFTGGIIAGERVSPRRWLGTGIAFGGLVWLLWPGGATHVPITGAAMMAAAGVGWGLYSLIGRGASDPLGNTATNFVLAAPLALILLPFSGEGLPADPLGIGLAILSGAVTSALGYALWYTVLPRLTATGAGVAQLSVPVIAMAGGMALLGEVLDPRFVVATALVLGGLALSLWRR